MTIVKHSIDAETAEKAVAAAAKKATELKLKMCIAIADETGDIKAFLRMDGAPKLSIDIAQNKAYTAASFSMPTHAWFDFIKDDPPLLYGITHTPRLTVFGGGFPIKLEGEIVARDRLERRALYAGHGMRAGGAGRNRRRPALDADDLMSTTPFIAPQAPKTPLLAPSSRNNPGERRPRPS